MKKLITLFVATIMAVICLGSCGRTVTQTTQIDILNDWQKEVLAAERLPTEADQLTESPFNSIQRIYEMITYLNEKDNEEFIYAGYLEPVVNQTETLYAYPRLLGNDYSMKTVTVKATKERFTDDYSDRSIVDYAEEMANDFIIEYFNSNQVEEFAVNYSKWLYEHELNGRHRINVVKNYSIKDMIYGKIKEYYNSDDYVGFYSFAFDSDKTNIIPVSHIGYEVPDEYTIGEYFDKYSK